MRPFRFTIFVATTTGLLVLAAYLWTPLIVANLPNPTLARAPVASHSVESVKAAPGILRPSTPRSVRTARAHRKQSAKPGRSPALKVLHVVRPAVSLLPRTVNSPVTASGAPSASTATTASGARLQHPASPGHTPIALPPATSSAPSEPAPSSSSQPATGAKPITAPATKPKPAAAVKPIPAAAVKPQPVPSPTGPSATQPSPQPSPASAAPDVAAAAVQPAETTRQPSAPPPVDTGGQTPPPAAVPKFWLGYADTYFPRGSGLPSIWKASPGVTFVGCGIDPNEDGPTALDICPQQTSGPPGDSLDGGAIRIDNTSTVSSLVVTGPASVTIGSCVYTPWPGLKRTIPPGGTLILTQTGLSGDPCGADLEGNYDFDTSESSGNGNCVPSPSIPMIALTINGTPTPIRDTGQILNQHGTDPGACLNQNEFEDWTPVP